MPITARWCNYYRHYFSCNRQRSTRHIDFFSKLNSFPVGLSGIFRLCSFIIIQWAGSIKQCTSLVGFAATPFGPVCSGSVRWRWLSEFTDPGASIRLFQKTWPQYPYLLQWLPKFHISTNVEYPTGRQGRSLWSGMALITIYASVRNDKMHVQSETGLQNRLLFSVRHPGSLSIFANVMLHLRIEVPWIPKSACGFRRK